MALATAIEARVETRVPVVPPALPVLAKPKNPLSFLLAVFKNNLSAFTETSFKTLFDRARVLGREVVLVNDPVAARHVFGAGAASYRRPVASLRIIRSVAGAGVLTAEGADWRRQRRTLAPSFTPAAIERLIPHFKAAAEDLVERLTDRGEVDLADEFHATALDAVLRALFSTTDIAERQSLAILINRYLAGPGKPRLFDAFAPTEEAFGWDQASRRRFGRDWAAAVDALIVMRRTRQVGEHQDMLDVLLAARDPETGEPLPDAEIRDQCGTMLFAGHETTARLLFWASYMLCLDGDEQARLRAEAEAFAPTGVIGLADLEHWPRHRLVLLETLRLYPPAPNIVRVAVEDTRVGDESIRAGTQVWIVPFVLHRHCSFWDQPTAFMPDRFVGKSAPWLEGAFIPFGAGPRICIGASFALIESQIILATVLSRFRLSLPSPQPVLPVGKITLVPDHQPVFVLTPI